MEWHTLPPLTALRAFAALAAAGSASAAGARLNVSHAAISQQVKALEARLALALVDRSGRALTLTAEGRHLAEALEEGFGTIARSIEVLTGAQGARPLHISTTPSFAAAWLMPQLAGFHSEHPDVDIIVSTTPELQPLEPGGVDVALRYGDGRWPGLDSELIFASPMVVVAAPALVGEREFDTLSDIRDLPLIQDTGTSEASNWLKHSGVLDNRCAMLVQLPGNLLLDAARDGRGAAVAIRAFVEKDIEAGRLRLLFQNDDTKGYHIVTRPDPARPALRIFVRWLRKCRGECGLHP